MSTLALLQAMIIYPVYFLIIFAGKNSYLSQNTVRNQHMLADRHVAWSVLVSFILRLE